METEVIAENLRRGRRQDLGEALKELGLTNDYLLHDGGLQALQDGGPTDARSQGIDLGQGQHVVVLFWVFQLLQRTRHLGEFSLQRQDVLTSLLRPGRIVTHVLHHPRHMRRKRVAYFLGGGLFTEIMRPFRERGARLPEVEHDLVLILRILIGVDAQERADALLHELRREFRETLWGRRAF